MLYEYFNNLSVTLKILKWRTISWWYIPTESFQKRVYRFIASRNVISQKMLHWIDSSAEFFIPLLFLFENEFPNDLLQCELLFPIKWFKIVILSLESFSIWFFLQKTCFIKYWINWLTIFFDGSNFVKFRFCFLHYPIYNITLLELLWYAL